MGDSNKILKADNTYLAVTNVAGTAGLQQQLQGLPLGTPSDSATGTVAVKVMGLGSGGGIPTTGQTVTANVAYLGASSSQVIPSGAKGWTYSITSGTATVGGVANIPAGVSDSDSNTLAASLTITTAAASSAYVRWNT